MHALYNQLTGYAIAWGANRRYAWEQFCLRFTADDLRTVIRHIQYLERNHKPHRSLMFRSFISGPGSIDYFEEDLAEAKALAEQRRKPRPDPARESVRVQTGREAETAKVRTAAEIMEEQEFMKRCKREAGL